MKTAQTYELQETPEFRKWLAGLIGTAAHRVIAIRLARMEAGLLGNVKPVGEGVSEAKVDFGPGYRLYFVVRNRRIIVLLCGGDKSTQKRDIRNAQQIAKGL